MLNFLAVFFGGGVGAMLRYFITSMTNKYWNFAHWGTFVVNILGCFLIGYIFGLTLQKFPTMNPQLKLLITTGFLGGLTTFSTFSLDSFCLLRDGKIWQCALYLLASFAFGLFATYLGYLISK